jgi:hypothetical protein
MAQFAIERIATDPQAGGNMGDMPVFRLDQLQQRLPFGKSKGIFGQRG